MIVCACLALMPALMRPVVLLESNPPSVVTRAWQEAEKAAQTAAQDPKIEAKHKADLDSDTKVGKKYTEEVEKEFKLSKNEEYVARVQRIGGILAEIARTHQVACTWGDKRLNPFDYSFKVVEDKDINAFSLPGGYIYVYEGLLKFVESDDELASVLAHEISHASFRHVATLQREQSKLQAITLPLILIGIFVGGEAGPNLGTLSSLIGQAKGSGWSVSAEEAADYGGFQYMMQSKFNPVAMLTFMERLAKEQRFTDRIDLGIFQTHPPTRERADRLIQHLTERGIPIRRSLASPSYAVQMKPSDSGSIDLWFDGRKLTSFGGDEARPRAEEAAVKLNAFFDSVPDLFDVQVRDNVILGRRQPLFQVTASDSALNKQTPKEMSAHSVDSIRRSLYLLAYRVWDAR